MKKVLCILAAMAAYGAHGQLVADFSSTANVLDCNSQCIDFNDLTTGGTPTTWEWSFPGGVPATSTLQNPTGICYLNTGIFDVTLIVSDGVNSDTLTRTGFIIQGCVRPNFLFVPTAFSPNGDGYNEVLYVRGNNLAKVDFLIFDRYGAKVFESTDPGHGWDGPYKGDKAVAGVYTYIATITYADGTSDKLAGQTALVR